MDRKDFFSQALRLLVGKGLELCEGNPVIAALEKLAEDPVPSKKRKQRLPGASPTENEFQQKCTGCDACMIACPVNVVMIEDLDKRLPLIYPDEAPCVHCSGYPCIQACPTGALSEQNGTNLRFVNLER